jgi:hypothetical protein
MGAYGHIFSPSFLGKCIHQPKGIAFGNWALSQEAWRKNVHRAALTHALLDKGVSIRANLCKSAVEKFLMFPT